MSKFVLKYGNVSGARLSDAMRKAQVAALNRMGTGARTVASRNITTIVDVPYRAVLNAIKINRASSNSLKVTLSVDRKGIKLVHFKPKKGVHGASVMIRKGQRKEVPGAFIVNKLSGNVFARIGKNRKPIRLLYGPSIGAWFSTEKMRDILNEFVRTKFGAELSGKLEMYLKKSGVGSEVVE